MDADPADEPDVTDAVELISDGENLLVVGKDRRSVETFLQTKGLLEKARDFGREQLAPALRSSAELAKTVSDTIAESSLWLKVTPESADAIQEYGLTDSGVPGVAYAMAGTRGDIRQWVKVDTTARAQVGNPAVLSGVAGALSQAARQQEVAQLRELLDAIDQKLDQVLRGQRDEILGDLSGIESELRATLKTLAMEGDIDTLTWSRLFGSSVGVRQVQAKAILKLQGIADDLEQQKRFGDLSARLQQARSEVQLWLSVIARCATALDELAVLELEYLSAVEPARVDTRRVTLDGQRQDDRLELDRGIAVLMQRMDEAATTVNQNKIFHVEGVPKALESIEVARSLVKRVYDALGVEVDWGSLDPVQWRAAILQVQQWKNGLGEGVSLAWEKGKPVLIPLAMTTAVTLLGALIKGKIEPPAAPEI